MPAHTYCWCVWYLSVCVYVTRWPAHFLNVLSGRKQQTAASPHVIMMCVNTALAAQRLALSTSAESCNNSSIQCARLFIRATVRCGGELPIEFLCGGVVSKLLGY